CKSVAIGDLNADGKPDIVTTSGTQIFIFRNEVLENNLTASSFRAPIALPAESEKDEYGESDSFSYASDIFIHDLNGDQKPELLFACMINNNTNPPGFEIGGVSVYDNNVVGSSFDQNSFGSRRHFSVLAYSTSQSLAVGDLDGDNRPDVAIRTYQMKNFGGNRRLYFDQITFVWGGSSQSNTYPIGQGTTYPRSENIQLKIGDLNGDGEVELMAGGSVITNISHDAQGVDIAFQLSAAGDHIMTGDIDGDGSQDVLTEGGVYRNIALDPEIISFSPQLGRKSTLVTIVGNNFSPILSEN